MVAELFVTKVEHYTWQKFVRSASWEESEVSGGTVKGFTLLVQLSCVSERYKDKRRENRGRHYSMPGDKHSFLEEDRSSCRG